MSGFFSPYRHEFVRVGTCVPQVAVAEPAKNGDQVLALLAKGDNAGLALMVFPELCLSAYAIDDLLFQDAVLDEVTRQLERLPHTAGLLAAQPHPDPDRRREEVPLLGEGPSLARRPGHSGPPDDLISRIFQMH